MIHIVQIKYDVRVIIISIKVVHVSVVKKRKKINAQEVDNHREHQEIHQIQYFQIKDVIAQNVNYVKKGRKINIVLNVVVQRTIHIRNHIVKQRDLIYAQNVNRENRKVFVVEIQVIQMHQKGIAVLV